MASERSGLTTLHFIVKLSAILTTALTFEDGESPFFRKCCQDDEEKNDSLDPGLGLLAEMRTIVVTKGSPVTLNCSIAADPEFGNLTFFWKKDGHKIGSRSSKARIRLFANGTLHIRNAQQHFAKEDNMTDTGLYECYASNSVGTALAQRVKVTVAYLSKKFTQEPQNQRIPVGGTAYFDCFIEALPADLLIVWHKDGNILHTDKSIRYQTRNHALQINQVINSDAGVYFCHVTNKAFFDFAEDRNNSPPQWRISHSVYLNVTTDVKIQIPFFLAKPPNVTTIKINNDVVIECIISGSATVWYYLATNHSGIKIEPSSKLIILPGGSLMIHNASAGDSGFYSCRDVAEIITAVGKLIVLEEPTIHSSVTSRQMPLASTILLKCNVSGHPKPQITWLKDGKVVTKKQFRIDFLKEELVIYQSDVSDSGYYQCLAENQAGWVLALARIEIMIVDNAPPAPKNVTAVALSSSAVLVAWSMDRPSGKLLGFTVHSQRADGVDGEMATVIDSKHQELVISGLKQDTQYIVMVKAYSKHGASLNSKAVLVHTRLSAYPIPTVIPAGDTGVLLSWSDFYTRHKSMNNVAAYQIFFGLADSDSDQSLYVNADQDKYLLKGLKRNSKYKIRMKAIFKGDDPDVLTDNWEWQHFITGGEKPGNVTISINSTFSSITSNSSSASSPQLSDPQISAPYILQAFPLTPVTILLEWNYNSSASDSGKSSISHYDIRCQAVDSLVTSDCKHSAKTMVYKVSHGNNLVIKDLQPFTLYNITVLAYSGELSGPYSRSIYVRTKEDVPSRPENLKAQVLSIGEVHLYWQPPTSPNGLIQGHYIFYNYNQMLENTSTSPIDESINYIHQDAWTKVYQQGNMTSAIVGNLTQLVYFFQVKACTTAGMGEPSTLVVVHMSESGPSGLLSDHYWGILGGSVIGLTSIIITVIVITIKQRQLHKQQESQAKLETGKWQSLQLYNTQPLATVLQQQPVYHAPHFEELQKLLSSRMDSFTPVTVSTVADALNETEGNGLASSPLQISGDSIDRVGVESSVIRGGAIETDRTADGPTTNHNSFTHGEEIC